MPHMISRDVVMEMQVSFAAETAARFLYLRFFPLTFFPVFSFTVCWCVSHSLYSFPPRQSLWPSEWEATSRNRFRSPNDMQFGFSYFYYLMYRKETQLGLNKGEDKKKNPTVIRKVTRGVYLREIDTNNDDKISENEVSIILRCAM